MVVEKDVDLDNIERSGIFDGLYFVLGGTVVILAGFIGKAIPPRAGGVPYVKER